MKTFIGLLAIFAAALGFFSFAASYQAPIREIEALLFFLIAAVFISGAAILGALEAAHQDLKANGSRLDRLGAALATPPELPKTQDPITTTYEADTYLVQLSDGVRGTFTQPQLQALLDRGIVDSRAFVLPAGARAWVRLSELAKP